MLRELPKRIMERTVFMFVEISRYPYGKGDKINVTSLFFRAVWRFNLEVARAVDAERASAHLKTQWAGGTCYNHLFIVGYIIGWWPTPFRES